MDNTMVRPPPEYSRPHGGADGLDAVTSRRGQPGRRNPRTVRWCTASFTPEPGSRRQRSVHSRNVRADRHERPGTWAAHRGAGHPREHRSGARWGPQPQILRGVVGHPVPRSVITRARAPLPPGPAVAGSTPASDRL